MFWLVYVPDTIMGAERNNLELPIIGNSVASETQRNACALKTTLIPQFIFVNRSNIGKENIGVAVVGLWELWMFARLISDY